MTHQEFENLTGMKVDDLTFSHAEDIYLAAGALTKEQVCREFKKHPFLLESETVAAIAEEMQDQRRLAAACLHDIEKLKAALLDACILADDETVWRGAAELVGRATVITYKLANDADLNKDDVAYILENLK